MVFNETVRFRCLVGVSRVGHLEECIGAWTVPLKKKDCLSYCLVPCKRWRGGISARPFTVMAGYATSFQADMSIVHA